MIKLSSATDGSGVSFVVVVLLELVFGDAFGDRGVYEGVVADENAGRGPDAVAAGLKKTRSPGLSSLRSIFCPRLAISWDAREFHTENPVVHEAQNLNNRSLLPFVLRTGDRCRKTVLHR